MNVCTHHRIRFALKAAFLLANSALIACGGDSNSTSANGPETSNERSVVYGWSSQILAAVKTSTFGPPPVARAIGMIQTAEYDAWSAYDAKAIPATPNDTLPKSVKQPIEAHTEANKREAISYAAYRTAVALFPAAAPQFANYLLSLGYDAAVTSEDDTTPSGIGNRAARLVLASRSQDGSNQDGSLSGGSPYSDYTGYTPVNTVDVLNDPGRWQPIRFANGAAPGFLCPHWGSVAPFALTTGDQFRPSAPAAFGTPQFKAQADELLELSANLSDEQKIITEYWAQGPGTDLPPGAWVRTAQYVANRDLLTIDEEVVLFFAIGNALFDAGVAAWDAKRAYDYVRPITAIRTLYKDQEIAAWGGPGQGTVKLLGQNWMPYQLPNFITPPFPEFVSGHSTFSAASAEVLRSFTGSDSYGDSVTFAPASAKFEAGVPSTPVTLRWVTFTDAAEEAGMSRLYGGIHFQDGNVSGQTLGRQVGAQVWERVTRLVAGG